MKRPIYTPEEKEALREKMALLAEIFDQFKVEASKAVDKDNKSAAKRSRVLARKMEQNLFLYRQMSLRKWNI